VAAASFSSTQSLTMVISSLLETYAAAERLFRIEDTPPEITEPEQPIPCGSIRKIEFDHVSFAYPGAAKPVLQNLQLRIAAGETLGIVGESGIGKSTILRLLLRFWNPTGGQIRINDIPLEKIALVELRRRIAVLEQDTFLFNGTIGENIALGKPNASQAEIETAARCAGLHDFITSLPEGYDTPMGQMGARLSGGERQRVGIARTMITDPDVIVMDEPTSSLDVLHEKELLHTLREACAGKMILIVSHRPSTLTGCGRVVRLADGQINP
ncbi:MAG TPA: ABC transporter ATP-binding protein, partial [Candidatus Ornithocaccomicrobium faecavium]|nr:ABC transporter ATP-binding protein [Candidatus Ornithocaccomicrobium faecavium]